MVLVACTGHVVQVNEGVAGENLVVFSLDSLNIVFLKQKYLVQINAMSRLKLFV